MIEHSASNSAFSHDRLFPLIYSNLIIFNFNSSADARWASAAAAAACICCLSLALSQAISQLALSLSRCSLFLRSELCASGQIGLTLKDAAEAAHWRSHQLFRFFSFPSAGGGRVMCVPLDLAAVVRREQSERNASHNSSSGKAKAAEIAIQPIEATETESLVEIDFDAAELNESLAAGQSNPAASEPAAAESDAASGEEESESDADSQPLDASAVDSSFDSSQSSDVYGRRRIGSLGPAQPPDASSTSVLLRVSSELRAALGLQSANTAPILLSYASQLVAGTNYFLKVRVGGEVVHARVYQDLHGDTRLVAVQRGHTADDPITYF